MNKINTIFSFVLLSFCLLADVSCAIPDFYCYDNFIAGMSPFSVPTSIELDDTGYWEDYSPIQDNLGFVTSYDNISMSGATPVSAVPSYDMDIYIGKSCYIPAGQAIVVYSSSGQMSDNRIIMQGSSMFAVPLGTTSPTIFSLTSESQAGFYGSNAIYSDTSSTLLEVPCNWNNSNLSSEKLVLGIDTSIIRQLPMSFEACSPYQYSNVYLLINYGSTDGYIYWNGYSGSKYNLAGIPYNSISWDIVTSNTYSSTNNSSSGNYVYAVPHIDGNFDLYSFVHSNKSSSQYYTYISNYDVDLDFDFSNLVAKNNYSGFCTVNFTAYGFSSARKLYMNSQLVNLPASSGLCPIFIHQYNATRYISGKAIYIYDGYISIQNYDELIDKLKEAGFGSGDLSRVIELLEKINSGGATGEEVKELIDTIENLENNIFNNLDTTEILSAWDTYKSLLDFSSLNWLIVANNRMFEIFAGVIVLAVIFIVFDRVMR